MTESGRDPCGTGKTSQKCQIYFKTINTYRILNFPARLTVKNFYSPLLPPDQQETDLKNVLGLQIVKTTAIREKIMTGRQKVTFINHPNSVIKTNFCLKTRTY